MSNGKRASPRKCSFRSRWGLQFTLCKIPSVERSPNVDQSITQPLSHCLIFGCLITLEIMYLLIVFFPLLGSSVAGFFGRFHIVIVAAFSLNSVTVNEKMKPHWIIFLTKPLVRLSFAYFYFLFCNYLLGLGLDISVMNFFSGSEDVNSASSADSNSLLGPGPFQPIPNGEPAPAPFLPNANVAPFHNSNRGIPLPILDQFRLLNQETELELFARIRLLENRLIEDLPPQLNLGEYEALVRGFLEDTVSVRDYCNVLKNELFDITVFELKANLLEGLVNLLMSEPTDRLTQILSNSPFAEPDRVIRSEALEFINDFMRRFQIQEDAARSPFERRLVVSMLNLWIQDAQQNGHLSAVYTAFVRYFLGLG